MIENLGTPQGIAYTAIVRFGANIAQSLGVDVLNGMPRQFYTMLLDKYQDELEKVIDTLLMDAPYSLDLGISASKTKVNEMLDQFNTQLKQELEKAGHLVVKKTTGVSKMVDQILATPVEEPSKLIL